MIAILATVLVALCLVVKLRATLLHSTKEVQKQQLEFNSPLSPLSLREMDEIKKYAHLFGLDNQSISDNQSLLEMGRKIEDELGVGRVNGLINRIYAHYGLTTPKKPKLDRSINRMVNSLIQSSSRIVYSFTVKFAVKIVGGALDAEDGHDNDNTATRCA